MSPINKVRETLNDESQFRLGYLPCIDGLRGVAILFVIAFHAQIPFQRGGFIGVDIFFVLSGFLITSLLIKEWNQYQTINLRKFYIRRALRLLPALIALLLTYIIVSFLFLQKATNNVLESLAVLFYVSNWAFAFGMLTPGSLGHAWSLSIEEQFYILWPVILIIMLRYIRSRFLMMAILIGAVLFIWLYRAHMFLIGASVGRINAGLDTRADSLLIGCALGIILSSNLISINKLPPKVVYYTSLTSALGLLVISVFANMGHPLMYYFVYSLVALFSSLLILSLVISQKGILLKVMGLPVLVWIGQISYGLYLWHFPVFRAILIKLNWSWPLVLVVGGTLTFVIAATSYYFLERPFLKLKTRLH